MWLGSGVSQSPIPGRVGGPWEDGVAAPTVTVPRAESGQRWHRPTWACLLPGALELKFGPNSALCPGVACVRSHGGARGRRAPQGILLLDVFKKWGDQYGIPKDFFCK